MQSYRYRNVDEFRFRFVKNFSSFSVLVGFLGATNYLPVAEHIAFLFDLMELSLNIHRLIELCIQIVKELPAVESQMSQKGWSTDRSYTNTLSLYVVGVLRRYHSCLLRE